VIQSRSSMSPGRRHSLAMYGRRPDRHVEKADQGQSERAPPSNRICRIPHEISFQSDRGLMSASAA
jgi:hypothetical protein